MYKCKMCGKPLYDSNKELEDQAIVHLERCHFPDLSAFQSQDSDDGWQLRAVNHFFIEDVKGCKKEGTAV